MNIQGKVIIITGASSGIGAATARAFAAHGARVVLAARDEAKLREVASGMREAEIVPSDMTSHASIEALVQRTVAVFGGVDVVVNNAGVGLAAPVVTLKKQDLQAALEVNLFGPLALTQVALPFVQQRRGQLIFVSSVVGLRALPYLGGYAATKAALDRLVESLRVEQRSSGVAVTLVRPGSTRTAFSERRLGNGHEQRRMNSRAATPEQVAQTILRAAERRSRVAYVSLGDRLNTAFSLLAPRFTDRMLSWAFRWEE